MNSYRVGDRPSRSVRATVIALLVLVVTALVFWLTLPRSMIVIINEDRLWVAAGRIELEPGQKCGVLRAFCSDAAGAPKAGVHLMGEVYRTKRILSGGQQDVSDAHGHARLFVTEEIDAVVINGVRRPNRGWNVLIVVVR